MYSSSRKRGRSMSRGSSKRSRSYGTGSRSTSRSSRTPVARTSFKSKIWPYQKPGASQLWDPFPSRATALLRYNETIEIAPTTGVSGHYLFRANSIFDPNFTGTGHQPYGHDTYQSIYNHYQVLKATCVVTPVNAVDCVFGCTITDDTNVQSDFDGVKETKGTVMSTNNSGGTSRSIVQTYKIKDQFSTGNQAETSALFGSNPSDGEYFDIWACGGTTGSSVEQRLLVTISYDVLLYELKDLGTS